MAAAVRRRAPRDAPSSGLSQNAPRRGPVAKTDVDVISRRADVACSSQPERRSPPESRAAAGSARATRTCQCAFGDKKVPCNDATPRDGGEREGVAGARRHLVFCTGVRRRRSSSKQRTTCTRWGAGETLQSAGVRRRSGRGTAQRRQRGDRRRREQLRGDDAPHGASRVGPPAAELKAATTRGAVHRAKAPHSSSPRRSGDALVRGSHARAQGGARWEAGGGSGDAGLVGGAGDVDGGGVGRGGPGGRGSGGGVRGLG